MFFKREAYQFVHDLGKNLPYHRSYIQHNTVVDGNYVHVFKVINVTKLRNTMSKYQ